MKEARENSWKELLSVPVGKEDEEEKVIPWFQSANFPQIVQPIKSTNG